MPTLSFTKDQYNATVAASHFMTEMLESHVKNPSHDSYSILSGIDENALSRIVELMVTFEENYGKDTDTFNTFNTAIQTMLYSTCVNVDIMMGDTRYTAVFINDEWRVMSTTIPALKEYAQSVIDTLSEIVNAVYTDFTTLSATNKTAMKEFGMKIKQSIGFDNPGARWIDVYLKAETFLQYYTKIGDLFQRSTIKINTSSMYGANGAK
jgi:hypothetical protein